MATVLIRRFEPPTYTFVIVEFPVTFKATTEELPDTEVFPTIVTVLLNADVPFAVIVLLKDAVPAKVNVLLNVTVPLAITLELILRLVPPNVASEIVELPVAENTTIEEFPESELLPTKVVVPVMLVFCRKDARELIIRVEPPT